MGEKRRALLIATDSYSDKTFHRLRTPRADADALAAVLIDPAIGGYEVETLHNPPAHEANLAIEDLFAAARMDDLVLLYVSGHGIKDDHGRLHGHRHRPGIGVHRSTGQGPANRHRRPKRRRPGRRRRAVRVHLRRGASGLASPKIRAWTAVSKAV
ncbi:caspase family protein [Saccharopolyspora antimicrobica]|uniref:caspase family protein n=1 Tax=Saccharopolyspora antimicrobica TaxID=455193 RepID=UPI000A441F95|nr:caspase family protein [Saccharopolyspora antimicrobica]